MKLDPRLTPARGDVAAAHLKGQVEADRFDEGVCYQVTDGVCPLRQAPSLSARLETQLLYGESFTVYDIADGWAWGQCTLDDYVGYAPIAALSAQVFAPDLRVVNLRTAIFPTPDLKSQPHQIISRNAKLAYVEFDEASGFVRLARGGWSPMVHLAPLDLAATDWVARAEQMLGAPYLWGGKDSIAVDCSGLIQSALETAGIAAPRDTDMQEAALGREIGADLARLERGDLIFWDGHVGVMRDANILLHANGFHMKTVSEPLAETIKRLGAPRTIKRLPIKQI
ncbi:MAG: NlpC/P60 family protein [Hyphomonadaceae bacterium]|nr:NlpC/P60 family protein [Hyphomonadaceae bacterium]